MRYAARLLVPLALLALACQKGAEGPVRFSGNIEATETQVSFKVPGRLAVRAVEEGQVLQAGQVVARLHDEEYTQEVARAEGQVAAARALLREMTTGFRPEEVAQAEASVEAALSESRRFDEDLARQRALFEREVISQREFEASRAAAEAAGAALKGAREHLDMLVRGQRGERIEAARAQLEQAEAALELARIRLAETEVASPLAGVVIAKAAEPGEVLAPGAPVVTVADLSKVWLRAYVDEVDLGRVKVGQRVRVTADTFPGKVYGGRVSYLSPEAEFTPKAVQTQKERVRLVYRIKVTLDNAAGELKPGMPADGEVEAGP